MVSKRTVLNNRFSFFMKLPLKLKIIAVEALLLMGLIRFFILVFPFRRVASIMGKPMCESSDTIDPLSFEKAQQIAWFINRISRRTPWESRCLVKALSAQVMLKRRKIPSTLYLGMAKNAVNKLSAHAWLRCGNSILVGDEDRPGFVPVAYFSA